MKKWIFMLAALAISAPVLAQSTATLTKGQIMLVEPDGKVTVRQRSMEPKMEAEMKKQGQPATKGLRVWFDQDGQLFYHTDPDAISRAMKK